MKFGNRTVARPWLALAACAALAAGAPASAFAASSWAMLDAKSGRFIGEEDGKRLHPPASLAKMMTVYLTFDALKSGRLKWNDRIRFSKNASSKIPMKLGVKPGDTITVREAVNSMIVLSANDVAAAMGEHLAGSEAAFARAMTQRARKLGMKDTVFANPSGLTEKTRQVTTARDMALLGLALRRDFPREFPLFSQSAFTFRGKTLRGHNNLMYRYGGVDGIKTGYTSASGYNLVSSLNAGGSQLVGVVLGGQTARKRDDLMASLLTRFSTGGTAVANAAPARTVAARTPLRSSMAPLPAERPQQFAAVMPPAGAGEMEQGDGGFPTAALGGGWRIQVGSLPDTASAERVQAAAAAVLQGSGLSPQGSIEPFRGEVSTFYRVRFAGFENGKAAESACASMKRQKIDCFVISDR